MATAFIAAVITGLILGWVKRKERRAAGPQQAAAGTARHHRPRNTPPSWKDRLDELEAERYGRHDPHRLGGAARAAA